MCKNGFMVAVGGDFGNCVLFVVTGVLDVDRQVNKK
jgi:hypothetical protein